MQFNTYIYMLLFLPVTILGYFVINKFSYFLAKIYLASVSIFFYAYAGLPGFQWLVIVPKYKNYVITMYMDQNRKTILWYIDMIDGQGTDEDGVCFYNDLFLDLIILDSGEIVEDDRDELDMALAQGVISKEQYTRVNETALYLKERLRINSNWILDYCQETMIKIEKEISEDKCKVYS